MQKVFCILTVSCLASFSMGAKPAQSERKHPPSPEALVALAFERFDFDSNVAINLEELEAVLDELHKNRPEPHPGRGPNEERPPKHVPPPLHRLFEEADLNLDGLLWEHELYLFFEDLERAHRASRERGRDPPGPPPPGGAPL